jgi:hypothetical protein
LLLFSGRRKLLTSMSCIFSKISHCLPEISGA